MKELADVSGREILSRGHSKGSEMRKWLTMLIKRKKVVWPQGRGRGVRDEVKKIRKDRSWEALWTKKEFDSYFTYENTIFFLSF